MDALVWHGGSDLSIEQIDSPQPASGEVVVDIEMTGICGSDLHAYRGHGGKRQPPLVLGHEAVGRVRGDDTLYALFPLRGCGNCGACVSGHENLCAQRQLLGLDRQGTFAQRVSINAGDLVAVPDGVSTEQATLTEPLATALNGLDGLDLGPGSRVVVIGLGPIGLLSGYAAAGSGAEVVGVDPVASRRRHAHELNVTDTLASVAGLTAASFDAVIDAVGVTATWSAGIEALTGGGTIVIVGLGESDGPMSVGTLVRAGLTVRGTYAYTREHFHAALTMLCDRPPAMSWVGSESLAQGADAFKGLAGVTTDAAKILLRVDPS